MNFFFMFEKSGGYKRENEVKKTTVFLGGKKENL